MNQLKEEIKKLLDEPESALSSVVVVPVPLKFGPGGDEPLKDVYFYDKECPTVGKRGLLENNQDDYVSIPARFVFVEKNHVSGLCFALASLMRCAANRSKHRL